MHQIEAIIFDLGRVLIDVLPERGIFGLVVPDNHQTSTDKLQAIMSDPAIKQHNSGIMPSQDFFLHINRLLKLDLTFEEFRARWCNIFAPIPAMADILPQLGKKYKLGLLSDTDPIHWDFIRKEFQYLDIFTNPSLSFNIGCCKPDPKTYLTTCKMIDADPARTLFIDDLPKNVEGALAAGLQAFQHKTAQETIDKLRQRQIL